MKNLFFIAFFTLTVLPFTAHADVSDKTVDNARIFVQDMTDEGIGIIESKSEDIQKQFRVMLERNFDMPYIARFAMGRYWRTMDKQQQKQYTALFEDMIVDVYSKRFSEYNGERVTIKSARADGKYDVLVKTKIESNDSADIFVDWRVRDRKGRLKVIDIMVEGVSMALTQRAEFSSVIQRGGGDVNVLIANLEKY